MTKSIVDAVIEETPKFQKPKRWPTTSFTIDPNALKLFHELSEILRLEPSEVLRQFVDEFNKRALENDLNPANIWQKENK